MSGIGNTTSNGGTVECGEPPSVLAVAAVSAVFAAFLTLGLYACLHDRRDRSESMLRLEKWRKDLDVWVRREDEDGELEDTRSSDSLCVVWTHRIKSSRPWVSIPCRPDGDAYSSLDRVFVLFAFVAMCMIMNSYQFASASRIGLDDDDDGRGFWAASIAASLAASLFCSLVITSLLANSGDASVRARFRSEIRQAQYSKRFSVTMEFNPSDSDNETGFCYHCICITMLATRTSAERRLPLACKIVTRVLVFLLGLAALVGTMLVSCSASGDRVWLLRTVVGVAFDAFVTRVLWALFVAVLITCQRTGYTGSTTHQTPRAGP
jgi:hypothetical protein